MQTYIGSCHCGGIRFRFRSEPITTGVRCNCSLCIRRGAVMSSAYIPAADFELLTDRAALAVYQWGDRMMNHYFCPTCGIYPFCDVIDRGDYRVNLGCVDGLDPLAVAITLIDGRSL